MMGSQVDLDQGGTFREFQSFYLGPSIGWVFAPQTAIFSITQAGTYNLQHLSATLVSINVAAAVTIVLPPGEPSDQAPAIAHPGQHLSLPIVIADIGGNAAAHPITIQAAAGDTIMGLPSIQITIAYGAFTLYPQPDTRTWISVSP